MTLKKLMADLGCDRYPERWEDFFQEVLEGFNKKKDPLLSPDFYRELNEKYRVLERHLDIYQEAALKISQNENLSLFFSLLSRAMLDRGQIQRDLRALDFPKAHNGEDPLPYNMLPGLFICGSIPSFYEYMKAKGMPDDVIYPSLSIPEASVDTFMRKHGGAAGFGNFDWYQLFYDRRLYRIDGFNMEFPSPFPGIAKVLQNSNGDTVALATNVTLHRDGFPLGSKHYEDAEGSFVATYKETDDSHIGHPYNEKGFVEKESRVFSKSEWSTLFSGGSGMVSIHIPKGARFDPETIENAIAHTKELIKKHFPEFDYKLFFCGSWLLDPQLGDILREDSNIVRFCRRFKPLAVKDSGSCVFGFVFNKPDMNFELSELPEDTSLERALKKHYLDGKAIYETFGYFLP